MSYPIKTSISSPEDIYDLNGQWLPKGNYYFSITRLTDNTAEGNLFERAFQASYKFKLRDMVKMMSGAQARLARRANISHLNMPSIASPTGSPTNIPNEIVARRNIQTSPTHSIRRQLPHLPVLATSVVMCTICLEIVEDNDKRTLGCNHHFHENCINRWLSTRPHCPVCRRHVNGRRANRAVAQQRREIRNRYNIVNNNMRVRGSNGYIRGSNRYNNRRSRLPSLNQEATRNNVRERNRNRLGRGRASEYNRHYSSSSSLIS